MALSHQPFCPPDSASQTHLGSGGRSKRHEGQKDDAHDGIGSLHGVLWDWDGLGPLGDLLSMGEGKSAFSFVMGRK